MKALSILALLAVVSAVPLYTTDATIYVSSTDGADHNAGTTASAPVQTLPAALAKVRQHKATSLLLDGTFRLEQPLLFNMRLSGLRVDQWPGKPQPIISGSAMLLGNWTASNEEPGVWYLPIPESMRPVLDGAATIYVNNQARAVIRTNTLKWKSALNPDPKAKAADENKYGFVYEEGSFPEEWVSPESWSRWRVAAFHSWNKAYHRVQAVYPHNNTILFTGPAMFAYGAYNYCSLERWYIENAPEMNLTAGTWRTSADLSKLYYAPVEGEIMQNAIVELPMLPTLLKVQGAQNFSLNNVIIERASGVPSCGASTAEKQACDSDLASMASGALQVVNSDNFQAVNLTVRDVGGYGLKATHSPRLVVDHSLFSRMGAGGLFITQGCDFAQVKTSYVIGFGARHPAGCGIILSASRNGSVAYNDVSGGLYNGLIYGGTHDSGAFSTFEFNHVHSNGAETDDGICDFGAIHGSNPGSVEPIYIRSNLFHNITAYQNGGNGVYLDAGSVGLEVSRNLVYDVSGSALVWNTDPTNKTVPDPVATTRILNNVFIGDRDNAYGRSNALHGQNERNPMLKWNAVTPAEVRRNVFVVNTSAPSRKSWYAGQPCAAFFIDTVKHTPEKCTWDFADNILGAFSNSSVGDNVYFNASDPQANSPTFPGSCAATQLGQCGKPGTAKRTSNNHGCSCADLEQWQQAGADTRSLTSDPQLDETKYKLVTSFVVQKALGIEPLKELLSVGPDWIPNMR